MQSATQLYSPHRALNCNTTMVEAITPDSVTDGVSTEELDENLCNAVSPGLSDELVDHGLGRLENQLNPAMLVVTSSGYSPPPANFSPSTAKNGEKKWNLVKVHVGFDVTRKGERSLVIDGYKFTKSRDGMGDRVFWRCSRRECKATAVTVSDRVEHIRAVHTHQPPVAAEFFAENTVRCEQEVRFNNTASYPRSRVRRRSQPNQTEHSQPQKLSATCVPIRDDVHPNSTSTHNALRSESHYEIAHPKGFEQVSPGQAISQSSTASINGFAAQTLTALITHLVETNPTTKSFRPSTSVSQPNVVACTNGPVLKTDCLDSWCGTNHTDSVTYVNGHTHPPITKTPECKTVPTRHSGPSGLEQLAAIATSFANSGTTVSCGSNNLGELNPKTSGSLSHTAPISPVSDPSLSSTESGAADNIHLSTGQMKCVTAANVIAPGTVGFIGKNSQGQLVVLSGEQLSELLRVQQSQKVSCSLEVTGHEQTVTNETTIITHSERQLPKHSTHSPPTLQPEYHANSSRHWDQSDMPGSSSIGTTNQGIEHWNSSTESITSSDSRGILSRLDDLPKSLSCFVSLSDKSPDASRVHGPPGLLVHWKKEKMRESVEEDGAYPETMDDDHSDLVQLSETPLSFTTRPDSCINRGKRQSGIGLLTEGPVSKMPCCCEDVTSRLASNTVTTVNSNQVNQAHLSTQATEMYHVGPLDTPSRQTQQSLTVSVGLDEEDTLCNQIQDGVLVKVLNTVQQLTAKLDADADPPEVIQNCRAIQACLDTIAAIKRVRSASGTCSPKTGFDTSVKPVCPTTNVFSESSLLSVHTTAQNRVIVPGAGCQNSSVRHYMDVLPV
ncbi:unnamed protein product [Echinostoma caproni]|uniref:C2H2-type domain-containing protein n=1 Tax=Echinostoma caproni TaxID=27848 RepID=A0A183ADN5_9TREM|nr:unnamed protein product [Echinostoma caproni]